MIKTTLLDSVLKLPVGLNFLQKVNFSHKLGILDRIYGNSLARCGIAWIQLDDHLEWKLDLTDATQRWIVYGFYENRNIIEWIRSFMANGGIAIESGANIGQTLLYYVDLADRILAIEPLPSACDWLSECILRNQLDNVEVLQAGIADKTARLSLQIANAQSTFRPDWYLSKNHETIDIVCQALDKITKEEAIYDIRFWKLDVEGMEYEALCGASELLKGQKIDAIYIEITGGNFIRVRNLLMEFGYRLFHVNAKNLLIPVSEPDRNVTNSYIAQPSGLAR